MQNITLDELRALLAQIPNDRWRAAVLVTFWHGLRASETLALTPANFNEDGLLVVKRLKGSRTTVHQLISYPELVSYPELDEIEALAPFRASAKRTERLFPWTRFGFIKLMQRAGARAGLAAQKRHPHSLKHGCAITGLEGGMKINELQTYLGHVNGSSTLVYLRVTDAKASAAFCAAVGGER